MPVTVVFFHAHPDDEAIFTGGTIARLTDAGVRCVVVMATAGESGNGGNCHDALADDGLGSTRRAETALACELLGVHRVEFLGYTDSGLALPGDPLPASAFAIADAGEAAERLAAILEAEDASALVYYDEGGIYGHADHLAVHRVGRRAGELAGTSTVYEATVDREYLHFVDTHLVEVAALAIHEAAPTGVPTVLISTVIDAGPVLGRKREAMGAHASQLPHDSAVMSLDNESFAAVYGYEWFIRTGPAGVLDEIGF